MSVNSISHQHGLSQIPEERNYGNWLNVLKKISKIAIPIFIVSELISHIPTAEASPASYAVCIAACESVAAASAAAAAAATGGAATPAALAAIQASLYACSKACLPLLPSPV